MRLRGTSWNPRYLQATAAVLLGAIVFAITLSAAPQVHESLHQASADTTHQCAATLISAGSIEHSACAPILSSVALVPVFQASAAELVSSAVSAPGSSLLEHAPPAQS
ncbi:MAG: hypothetical protein M3Z22_07885 [Verrucomicrobiota bacterium]|nr:hypothetical protein [Verrucomicrobiota bacterium]